MIATYVAAYNTEHKLWLINVAWSYIHMYVIEKTYTLKYA